MAKLIDENYPRCREDILCRLFSVEEVEAIKTIPICLRGREDVQVWYHTNNGVFSVKSAYHLHKELEAMNEGEPSSRVQSKEVWKSIW